MFGCRPEKGRIDRRALVHVETRGVDARGKAQMSNRKTISPGRSLVHQTGFSLFGRRRSRVTGAKLCRRLKSLEPRAGALPGRTCSSSCSYRLHLLRSWSLQTSRSYRAPSYVQCRRKLKVLESSTFPFWPIVIVQSPSRRGSGSSSMPVYQYHGPGGGAFKSGFFITMVVRSTEPSGRIIGRMMVCSISRR